MSKQQQIGVTSSSVILFHTEACHLCEQAIVLLNQLEMSYQLVDICDEKNDYQMLSQRYGERIPVCMTPSNGKELEWPFDLDALKQFVGVSL